MSAEARAAPPPIPEPPAPSPVQASAPPVESLRHAQARVLHYRTVLLRAGQEIARRLARLDTLAAAMGEANEPSAVLQEALDAARGMLDAECGAIVVIEDEHQPPTLGARHALPPALEQLLTGREFEPAVLLLPRMIEGDLLVLSAQDERKTSPALRMLLASLGLGWLLSLPLRSGGKLLGALVLGAARPAVITAQESHWLALVGQQAALALEAVRLRKHMWSLAEAIFGQESETATAPAPAPAEQPADLEALLEAMMAAEEEVQHFNQDLTMLNRLGEALGQSLNPGTVLQTVVEECQRILGVPKAWVYVVEEDQPGLTLRVHRGLSSRYLQARGRLDLTDGQEAQALASGAVVLLEDMLESGRGGKLLLEAEGVRGTCLVPLCARGRPLGLLCAAHDAPHHWSSRERRLAMAIGAQASLALQNALLYEQVRDGAQAQVMSNRVLQELNRSLLDSQGAQAAQLEQLQRSAETIRGLSEHSGAVRAQVVGLYHRVRALSAPETGPLTPSQQAHIEALVRELAALSHALEVYTADPAAPA